jgi:mannose-6-phosphate isomerase-like protein (cupin superfamily)
MRAFTLIGMRHISTAGHRSMFDVLITTASAQAAMMTLQPGKSSSDEPTDEHPRCEQWLFVIRGAGRATTGRRRIALKPNMLLLIETGEPHQITCTGSKPLVTLNLYVPPAYTKRGELKLLARVPTVKATVRKLL